MCANVYIYIHICVHTHLHTSTHIYIWVLGGLIREASFIGAGTPEEPALPANGFQLRLGPWVLHSLEENSNIYIYIVQ